MEIEFDQIRQINLAFQIRETENPKFELIRTHPSELTVYREKEALLLGMKLFLKLQNLINSL